MATPERPTIDEATLSTCDREPIHIPGSIQPHGLLFVLDGGLVVRHVGRNADGRPGLPAGGGVGRPIGEVLEADPAVDWGAALSRLAEDGLPASLGVVPIGGEAHQALGHRHDGWSFLELEPIEGPAPEPFDGYALIKRVLGQLEEVDSVEGLAQLAASHVRRITGFDRVLVYRFDEDGHGTVVAEDRNGRLPGLLGHRFPGSDVPRQARELYRRNRLRLIPDASYVPVPLIPEGDRPIDLSFATLRSVSPVHLEYMRNMGTAASMSISVLRDGDLWGLIACHHAEPRRVPFEARSACDVLAQVLSLQITSKEKQRDYRRRLELGRVRDALIAALAGPGAVDASLAARWEDLLRFARADGAAILYEGRCVMIGATPSPSQVRKLAGWLTAEGRRDVFATDSIARDFPWAEAISGRASGLLSVGLSRVRDDYLMWFRPERVRTVRWAGSPHKPAPEGGVAPPRLSPRTSFETWKEVVGRRSEPWHPGEVEAAAELRSFLIGIVLKKAEDLAALNQALERTNQELEAFSYTVSHDLRAPFRHIVGYGELLLEELDRSGPPVGRAYLEKILGSAQYAGKLVDNLLDFSRMSRTALRPERVDMNDLVRDVVATVAAHERSRSIAWEVGDLPEAWADPVLIRVVVLNLVENAAKYTRPREEAVIRIRGDVSGPDTIYSVQDNGIGFDMKYASKLFGVFQRLHRMEDFEGTGIGLANVRRIVTRHGGRVWPDAAPDRGATFWFSLPRMTAKERQDHA